MLALPVSAYHTEASKELLQKLYRFSVSIRGGESCGGWGINTLCEYRRTTRTLRSCFLDHMPSVRQVTLKADWTGVLGCTGQSCTPLPFAHGRNQLASLTSLHIEIAFIEPPPLEFLVERKSTLRSLVLVDCHATHPDSVMTTAQNEIPWRRFFDCLREADMLGLRRLEHRCSLG